jgi:hypothetical protein
VYTERFSENNQVLEKAGELKISSGSLIRWQTSLFFGGLCSEVLVPASLEQFRLI